MSNQAIWIKDSEFNSQFRKQSLYKLRPIYNSLKLEEVSIDHQRELPHTIKQIEFVIVSAIDQLQELKNTNLQLASELLDNLVMLPETYIFESDSTGKVLGFSELPGSYRGSMDHSKALEGLGYEIVAPKIKVKTRFELIE